MKTEKVCQHKCIFEFRSVKVVSWLTLSYFIEMICKSCFAGTEKKKYETICSENIRFYVSRMFNI